MTSRASSILSQVRSHQVRLRAKPRVGWPDGRRQFGEVSGAVKTVLAEADAEMRVKDVHAGVERLLGGEVSFQSVADFLTKNSKGREAFVREAEVSGMPQDAAVRDPVQMVPDWAGLQTHL